MTLFGNERCEMLDNKLVLSVAYLNAFVAQLHQPQSYYHISVRHIGVSDMYTKKRRSSTPLPETVFLKHTTIITRSSP